MGFRRSRLLAAGTVSAFIGLALFASRSNLIADPADAQDLHFMVKHASMHLEDDAMSKKNYDMRVLTSIRNPVGFYNSIDVENTGLQIMNPTLLELPRGSEHEFLVIARLFVVEKEIDGVKYQLSRQVAMFANMTYNGAQRPTLTAGKWFKLIAQDYAGPEHHCKHRPDLDKYIGPEDMKLFWTRSGAPLLIFTMQANHEVLCQGMFLIDARACVPELAKVIGDQVRLLPPIQLREPTRLRREALAEHINDPRYERDKNWAPFQSPFNTNENEHFFVVEPGRIFRWTMETEIVEDIGLASTSAVEEPYPPWLRSTTWHSTEKTCVHDVMMADEHVHQSTPMLFLTLCNRGECEPHEGNTVMLAMVHRRYDNSIYPYIFYDRRIVVYASAPPYKMLSVSKKLLYFGETDKSYIWTGSMVFFFNHTRVISNRSHGFLDDEIWLSFGITDLAPGWLDVKASELIEDHYMCQSVSDE